MSPLPKTIPDLSCAADPPCSLLCLITSLCAFVCSSPPPGADSAMRQDLVPSSQYSGWQTTGASQQVAEGMNESGGGLVFAREGEEAADSAPLNKAGEPEAEGIPAR